MSAVAWGMMLILGWWAEAKADSYEVEREHNIRIASHDGLYVEADLLRPKVREDAETFPAIILLNPFGQPKDVFASRALDFARQGYLVLRFTPRGWRGSEGSLAVGQPASVEDVKACIGWLKQLDSFNGKLGVTGISEGAGTSLLVAAESADVTTVVAMSGWTDMNHPSNGDAEPLFWGGVLGALSLASGARLDDTYQDLFDSILYRNLEKKRAFFAAASPIQRIDRINAHRTPILLMHDMGDTLLPSNQIVDFYHQLTVPKSLILHRGMHAGAELVGLLSRKSPAWAPTHQWFDYWLKERGELPASFQVDVNRHGYAAFDRVHDGDDKLVLQMERRDGARDGTLTEEAASSGTVARSSFSSILGSWNGLSLGMPMLEQLKSATLGLPKPYFLDWVARSWAAVFKSAAFDRDVCLIGRPHVRMPVSFSARRAQLVFHVIDENPWGVGEHVTSGVKTFLDVALGQPVAMEHELYYTAHRLPRGHRLALAMDTFDAEYLPPNVLPYRVHIHHQDEMPSQIELPIVDCAEVDASAASGHP